ncbi:MAG: hypothetical protein NT022_08780 [Deltaproteobacteria bacterium]|nr:hypothetical protein [Deltaproteobacteria bacterium]
MIKIDERKINGRIKMQVWVIEGSFYLFSVIGTDQPDFSLKNQYPKFEFEQKAISAMNMVTLQGGKMVVFNHSLESEIPDISHKMNLKTKKPETYKHRKR